MQRCMAYQPFGLRLPCWVLTIFAKLLATRGPGWYSPAELKERLFTNKSKRPGDDTKEALRTDGNTIAWQAWDCSEHYLAVMSTRPTIGVSRRKGDFSCHVCPSRRRRTSHFPSLHSHSAGCIYEGTEEEKAGRGQCPG